MPESTALAALHEFSQLDTSRVRNVPGYIIGISKKVGPTRRGRAYIAFDVYYIIKPDIMAWYR
jgi:hypothetical protein